VGAYQQNVNAERSIRNLTDSARTACWS